MRQKSLRLNAMSDTIVGRNDSDPFSGYPLIHTIHKEKEKKEQKKKEKRLWLL